MWLGGPAIVEESEVAEIADTAEQPIQQYNKGCHGRPTNTTSIIKDAMVEQIIQQI